MSMLIVPHSIWVDGGLRRPVAEPRAQRLDPLICGRGSRVPSGEWTIQSAAEHCGADPMQSPIDGQDRAEGAGRHARLPGQIAFLDSILIEPYQTHLSREYGNDEKFVAWVFADLRERDLVAQYCLGGYGRRIPALTSSWLNWPIAACSASPGMRPASELLVAFTITMTRIAHLLPGDSNSTLPSKGFAPSGGHFADHLEVLGDRRDTADRLTPAI
jgi:hypothetical protein